MLVKFLLLFSCFELFKENQSEYAPNGGAAAEKLPLAKKYCLMQFSSLLFTFLKTCQLLESQKRGGLLLGPSLLHVMNVSPILPISQAFHGGFHQECVVASALQYYNAKYVEYMHNKVGSQFSYFLSSQPMRIF